MRLTLMVVSILLSFSSGCALGPSYRIEIDSISVSNPEFKTRYVLFSGIKDTGEDDLQYQEYAVYIERALGSQGYVKAERSEEADIAIFLGYGISDPATHQETHSSPVYGQTGISQKNTSGTVSGYGDTATYSSTTDYTPTYGVIGSKSYTETYTTYVRYMFMLAFDLGEYRRTNKEKEIWKTTVTSAGSSDDLREIFPVLVAASRPYIATSTKRKVSVYLNENDKSVLEVKGIQAK